MSAARMVGLRLYLCASGALSAHFAYSSPHIFSASDEHGRWLALLLFVTTCIVGALDTVINDVLSERWRLQWAKGCRNEGYIVLALANIALIFVAVNEIHHIDEHLFFLLGG